MCGQHTHTSFFEFSRRNLASFGFQWVLFQSNLQEHPIVSLNVVFMLEPKVLDRDRILTAVWLFCSKWLVSFFTVIPLFIILPSHYCWRYSVFMIVTYGKTKMNFSYYIAVCTSDFLLCFSLPSCVSYFSPHVLFPLLPPCFLLLLIPVFLTFHSYWGDRILFDVSSRWKKEPY